MLLHRRTIRASLKSWCIEALSRVDLRPAPHHELLIDRLTAIERGDITRLMVLMPPGSAKSTYVSTLFPPWYLARHPSDAIVAASHTSELSERFGRRVRNIINEHAATLNIALAPDIQAANQWETTVGGEYFAVGVLGAVTGRRADCLPGNTILHSLDGPVAIKNVELSSTPCYVLSYERRNSRPAYRRVVAIARRYADQLWRIRTASGRVVEATGNHRIFTARGWTLASRIAVGDVLLSAMWNGDPARGGRCSQGGSEGQDAHLLQSSLPRVGQDQERLPQLWQASAARQNMLEGMSSGTVDASWSETAARTDAPNLRELRDSVPEPPELEGPVLWEAVRRHSACREDERPEQSWLQAWARHDRAGIEPGLVCGEASYLGPRRHEVRGLLGGHGFTGPSHQPHPERSSLGEPRLSLPPVSPQASCSGEVDTFDDPVAMVERVCRDEIVYDIQVEGTQCFFANGILVHNCVIIDDPVKSRLEADSETIRARVWEWWKADLLTRLKPGAKIVLVMTRWHEGDLGGMLLDEMNAGGRHWEVLKLPMEAELNDAMGRAPGEPLWPEWFTDEMRADAKRDSRTWSALYQQSPAPATGIYFERDWLRPANSVPRREDMRIYGGSDYAVTADGGDWTVHVVIGVDPDYRLWLLDLWRGQTASDAWIEALCDMILQWKPIGWAEEQGQIKAGVGPFLDRRQRERRAFVARRQFPTRGDKAVRAQSIRGRIAMDGLHYAASAPWRAAFESELMTFPAGKHDDQVDALGLVGQLLDVMIPGQLPKPKPAPVDSWAKAFERSSREGAPEGWRVA